MKRLKSPVPPICEIETVIFSLRRLTAAFPRPLVDAMVDEFGHDPYLILVACLLSLRAKDLTTVHVCRELFTRVKPLTPVGILAVPREQLEVLIYKTGYYKTKARVLHEVSQCLIAHHESKVPATYQELMAIKGIGPKTANLVLGYAFGVPAICVDTHVHRIANRLGWVITETPEETEAALRAIVPQKYWIELNRLLVMWGQHVCTPIGPWCRRCQIAERCARLCRGKCR